MGLILVIIFIAIAAALGSSKGYSGVLCGVAGCFGGLIAIIVIALLPNRVEEQEEAAAATRPASHPYVNFSPEDIDF